MKKNNFFSKTLSNSNLVKAIPYSFMSIIMMYHVFFIICYVYVIPLRIYEIELFSKICTKIQYPIEKLIKIAPYSEPIHELEQGVNSDHIDKSRFVLLINWIYAILMILIAIIYGRKIKLLYFKIAFISSLFIYMFYLSIMLGSISHIDLRLVFGSTILIFLLTLVIIIKIHKKHHGK